MLIYFSIFLIFGAVGLFSSERQSRIALSLACLFLLWFMGTRYETGCDFSGYLHRFENLAPDDVSFLTGISGGEAGFEYFMAAVRSADLSYMWVNLLGTSIFVFALWVFCRNQFRPMMVLALLFPVLIIQLGMSGLRQAIACAFLMMASVAFVRQKRLLCALLIITGSLFHVSVVLFLPIAMLPGRTISIGKLAFAVLLLSPVSYILLGSRLETYIDRYIEDVYGEIESGGALVRYVLVFVPAVLFLRYRERVRASFPQMFGLLELFSIITLAILPTALASTTVLHRLNYYVMPVSVLTLVYVGLSMSPWKKTSFYRVAPLIMYGTYSIAWFMTSRHARLCYVPYQSYTFQ